LELISKKSKLNTNQKKQLDKKLSKLILLSSKLENKKELLNKKDEYVKMIALSKAKNRI
jgi:hypothetical protein